MRCSILIAIFYSGLAFSTNPDLFLDKASSELVYEKEETEAKPEQQKISITLNIQQIAGFIESADSITNLSARFNYLIKDSLSFSATQGLNRNYYIKTDEIDNTGLWIQDTSLSLNKTFLQSIKSVELAFGLSSSLPASYYSRLNKLYTVSSIYMSGSIKLLPLFKVEKLPAIKELNLFINSTFNYYFSEPVTPTFKKTKSEDLIKQSSSGKPLPQMLFGVRNFGLLLKSSDKLSFSGSIGRWAIVPYTLPIENTISPYHDKYYRHYYSLSLSTNYQAFKSLSFRIAYSHTDKLDKAGQIQNYLIFDDQVSAWLISAVYSFSKNKDPIF